MIIRFVEKQPLSYFEIPLRRYFTYTSTKKVCIVVLFVESKKSAPDTVNFIVMLIAH